MTTSKKVPSVSQLLNFEPPSREVADATRKAFATEVADNPSFHRALRRIDILDGHIPAEEEPIAVDPNNLHGPLEPVAEPPLVAEAPAEIEPDQAPPVAALPVRSPQAQLQSEQQEDRVEKHVEPERQPDSTTSPRTNNSRKLVVGAGLALVAGMVVVAIGTSGLTNGAPSIPTNAGNSAARFGGSAIAAAEAVATTTNAAAAANAAATTSSDPSTSAATPSVESTVKPLPRNSALPNPTATGAPAVNSAPRATSTTQSPAVPTSSDIEPGQWKF